MAFAGAGLGLVAIQLLATVSTIYFAIYLCSSAIIIVTDARHQSTLFVYLVWFFPLLVFNKLVRAQTVLAVGCPPRRTAWNQLRSPAIQGYGGDCCQTELIWGKLVAPLRVDCNLEVTLSLRNEFDCSRMY
jgi:hypothetical protein